MANNLSSSSSSSNSNSSDDEYIFEGLYRHKDKDELMILYGFYYKKKYELVPVCFSTESISHLFSNPDLNKYEQIDQVVHLEKEKYTIKMNNYEKLYFENDDIITIERTNYFVKAILTHNNIDTIITTSNISRYGKWSNKYPGPYCSCRLRGNVDDKNAPSKLKYVYSSGWVFDSNPQQLYVTLPTKYKDDFVNWCKSNNFKPYFEFD